MGHTMWCLMRHPEAAEKVRAECRAAFTAEDLAGRAIIARRRLRQTEIHRGGDERGAPRGASDRRRASRQPHAEDVGRVRRSGVRAHRRPSRRVFGRGEFSRAGSVPARTVSRHERERSGRVLPGRDGAAQVSRDVGLDAHDADFSTYATSTFDGWSPDLEGEGPKIPSTSRCPSSSSTISTGSSSNETGSTICEDARAGERKRGRERG